MDRLDVGQSIENGLSRTFEYIPQVIGALILLIIGYFISMFLGSIVRKLLNKIRFDRLLHSSAAGNYIARFTESPSRLVGKISFWLVFLFFISMSASVLNLPLLDRILNGIYAYIPNIIAAVLIFLVASAVSGGTSKFVQRVMGRTTTAKLISTVVPVVVLSIAGFMILDQLNIATNIITILFTAIVASISLGMALAFGLGGRDLAKDVLQQAYDSVQNNSDQFKMDIQKANINTKKEANKFKTKL